jgi:hypothetical protein
MVDSPPLPACCFTHALLCFVHSSREAIKAPRGTKVKGEWLRRSQKPTAVFSALLSRSVTNPLTTVVIDPCCGTGSSGVAALGLGCAGYIGLDIDPQIPRIVETRLTNFVSSTEKLGPDAATRAAKFYQEEADAINWRIMSRNSPTFLLPETSPEESMFLPTFCFSSPSLTDTLHSTADNFFWLSSRKLGFMQFDVLQCVTSLQGGDETVVEEEEEDQGSQSLPANLDNPEEAFVYKETEKVDDVYVPNV